MNSDFNQIRRGVRASEWQRIHAIIRDSILDVTLPPGSSISELDIAKQCGTSRTPVREALLRLADEGLVEILPQRGTYVTQMELSRLAEAIFVRQALESAVLHRLALLPDRTKLVSELADTIFEQERAMHAGNIAETLRADESFHRQLFDYAGMPGIWPLILQVRDLHHRVRAIAVPELGSAKNAIIDHRSILAALRQGNGDAAERAMRKHLGRNLDLAKEVARLYPEYFTQPTTPGSFKWRVG